MSKRKNFKTGRKSDKPKKNFWSGINLILAGVLLILLCLLWKTYRSNDLSFSSNDVLNIEAPFKTGFRPVRVSISSIKVNLNISEAEIVDGHWQIFENIANHLISSANPGGGGNIVLYGHNKTDVFGPIRWLGIGDEVSLTDENGKIFRYKINKTVEVSSVEISYVMPKSYEVLTMYTCSGIFDSKRFVATALPHK